MTGHEIRRVLVATDLGEPADHALRRANAIARQGGAELFVCHVLPNLLRLGPLFPHVTEQVVASLPDVRQAARDTVLAHASKIMDRTPEEMTVVLEDGSPYAAILDAADRVRADLIVVGTHGRRGLSHLFLGSVAERVVRHADCSVLVARPSPQTGKVIAAIDFSEESMLALEGLAGPWANRLRGGLTVVHVLDLPSSPVAAPFPYLPAALIPSGAELEHMRREATGEVDAAMKRSGVEGKAVILDGLPSEAIARHAKETEAELVVVGTVGRTGFKRMALGSVAESVVRQAPCSAIVVRRKAPAGRPPQSPDRAPS